MSGRDVEPIAAFFPSIDRNLIRDLDRQLRHATARQPDPPPQADPLSQAAPQHQAEISVPQRPSTSDVLEAVQQAASSMASMGQRIEELEAKQIELEAINGQLRSKLGELLKLQQTAESKVRTEAERAERAEGIAAHHHARAQILEGDLAAALGDLTRIAEAITGSLGAHQRS